MTTMTAAPGYWRDETSGVLKPAIEALVNGGPMTRSQIAAVRAYLRQWIEAPAFTGPDVIQLRLLIPTLTSVAAINRWLDLACAAGVDPI